MTENSTRVLLIDTDEAQYLRLHQLLRQMDGVKHALTWASSYNAGLAAALTSDYDVCLVADRLDRGSGLQLIREVVARHCPSPLVLMTGWGTRGIDVEATEAGAAGYLNQERLSLESLDRVLRYARAAWQRRQRRQQQVQNILQRRAAGNEGEGPPERLAIGLIREAHPALFEELRAEYERTLQFALDQGSYQGDHHLSARISALADRLGALRAQPRDVIEIHCEAIRRSRTQMSREKAVACAEEAGLLGMELMGCLAGYYRSLALDSPGVVWPEGT